MKPRPFWMTLCSCASVMMFIVLAACFNSYIVLPHDQNLWYHLSRVFWCGGLMAIVSSLAMAYYIRDVRVELQAQDGQKTRERLIELLLGLNYTTADESGCLLVFGFRRGFALWKWPISIESRDDGKLSIVGPSATLKLLLRRYREGAE